jgi:hypothetical protein
MHSSVSSACIPIYCLHTRHIYAQQKYKHKYILQRLLEWKLEPKHRKILDKRSLGMGLAGESSSLFAETYRMKSASYKRLADGPAFMIFRDVYTGEKKEAFQALLDILYRVLHTTCNADGVKPTAAMHRSFSKFKTDVAVAFVKLERVLPAMFFGISLHLLLHLPDCIYRWNHVRNYWCFASERFIGVIKQYCNARNNPHAGMVHGYTQTTFVRRTMSSESADRIVGRYQRKNIVQSSRSASIGFNDLVRMRGARPGTAKFVCTPTKRNAVVAKNQYVAVIGSFLRQHQHENHTYAKSVHARVQPSEPAYKAQVHRVLHGVEINGRPWRQGDHCVWRGDDNASRYGVVQEFISWNEKEQEKMVWCVKIKVHLIEKEENRVLYVQKDIDRYEFIFWQQLQYKCLWKSVGLPFTVATRRWSTSANENFDE